MYEFFYDESSPLLLMKANERLCITADRWLLRRGVPDDWTELFTCTSESLLLDVSIRIEIKKN